MSFYLSLKKSIIVQIDVSVFYRGIFETGSLRGGLQAINFRLFAGIGVSMIATVPFSMAFSAITFAVLRAVLL